MTPDPTIQDLLAELPAHHVAVLRGALSGFDADQLATLADVPVEAVLPMMRVAVAKLAHRLDDAAPDGR